MVRRTQHAQTMVENAPIAPALLLMIGATVDLGRGVLLNNLLSGASRETARLAALQINSGSNTLAPACSTLTTPCSATAVIRGAHLLDSLGVNVSYLDSTAISSPPSYGTYTPNADPTQPGTIALTAGDTNNTVYVFIYELDSTAGDPRPRWSCPAVACTGTYGAAVRTSGHQLVVVDLKLKWQPVLASFLGIPTVITFDSQSVDRIEF